MQVYKDTVIICTLLVTLLTVSNRFSDLHHRLQKKSQLIFVPLYKLFYLV